MIHLVQANDLHVLIDNPSASSTLVEGDFEKSKKIWALYIAYDIVEDPYITRDVKNNTQDSMIININVQTDCFLDIEYFVGL